MTASNAIEKPPINLGATLKEAGIAALIALALALPLAGFRLPDGGGSAFTTRPWWVVVPVVVLGQVVVVMLVLDQVQFGP